MHRTCNQDVLAESTEFCKHRHVALRREIGRSSRWCTRTYLHGLQCNMLSTPYNTRTTSEVVYTYCGCLEPHNRFHGLARCHQVAHRRREEQRHPAGTRDCFSTVLSNTSIMTMRGVPRWWAMCWRSTEHYAILYVTKQLPSPCSIHRSTSPMDDLTEHRHPDARDGLHHRCHATAYTPATTTVETRVVICAHTIAMMLASEMVTLSQQNTMCNWAHQTTHLAVRCWVALVDRRVVGMVAACVQTQSQRSSSQTWQTLSSLHGGGTTTPPQHGRMTHPTLNRGDDTRGTSAASRTGGVWHDELRSQEARWQCRGRTLRAVKVRITRSTSRTAASHQCVHGSTGCVSTMRGTGWHWWRRKRVGKGATLTGTNVTILCVLTEKALVLQEDTAEGVKHAHAQVEKISPRV